MNDTREVQIKMSGRELIVVILLVISAVINYVDRSNLSMAMPQIEHRFALSRERRRLGKSVTKAHSFFIRRI